MLVSSHVLHEVESMTSSSVVLIYQGRVRAHGTIAEIRAYLEKYPHKMLLRSPRARELARELMALESVVAVRLEEESVHLETLRPEELYETLPRLGSRRGHRHRGVGPGRREPRRDLRVPRLMIHLRGLFIVAAHAARSVFSGKRLLVLLGLAALPLLLLLFVPLENGYLPAGAFQWAILMLMLQVTVPVSALLLGVGVIGDEIEGRTITYLFTRPVGRGTLYLGRLLGLGAAWSLLFAVVSTIGLHARPIEPDPVAADLVRPIWIGILGFFAYLSAFAFVRMVFKRALLAGMVYIVALDGAISKAVAIGANKLSIWHYMYLVHIEPYGEARRIPGFRSLARSIAPGETAEGAIWVLAGIAVVSTLLGMWMTRSKEYPVAGAVA